MSRASKVEGARGFKHKMKVLALVDRKSGQARAFGVDRVSRAVILPIVRENVAREARLVMDEARIHAPLGKEHAEHLTVEHGRGEHDRGEAHTNTVEG